MNEERKIMVYVTVILLCSFLFVGLFFLAAKQESGLKDFCEKEGGMIEVVDRQYDFVVKTIRDVYGCVK